LGFGGFGFELCRILEGVEDLAELALRWLPGFMRLVIRRNEFFSSGLALQARAALPGIIIGLLRREPR
jgi:hypothetical protein